MTICEIAKACQGQYFGDPAVLTHSAGDVVIDSRKAGKDSLFIAIRGARVDGHDFIPQVMEQGALCAISEKNLGQVPYPYILVSDCLKALRDLAEHYRKSLDVKVVGISGSVGKTSTKEMVASVLSQKYKVLKTAGNFNNEIGLPLTVFRLRDEHQIAVLEMGISDFGEMTRLARIARPDFCILTNIGYAHLENLGSRDGILKAKTEMVDYLSPKGMLFLNGDDDKLRSYVPSNGMSPIYFGMSDGCDFTVTHTENLGLKGTLAEFSTPEGQFRAHVPIPGEHMVQNALAGAAVGAALGLSKEEIIRGIEALVPIEGRNNLIETGRYTILDDCYNANPASMRSSLDVLSFANTRKVAILGDMFELGENEKQLHYEIGAYASKKHIDVLVCIGSLSEETARGGRESGIPCVSHYKTKEAFFSEMDHLLHEQDTILVKASHGMEFSELIQRLS